MERFLVKNFEPIKKADIKLGYLTIFLGLHASGKSILLQLIKLIIDKDNVQGILHLNNYDWGRYKDTCILSLTKCQ